MPHLHVSIIRPGSPFPRPDGAILGSLGFCRHPTPSSPNLLSGPRSTYLSTERCFSQRKRRRIKARDTTRSRLISRARGTKPQADQRDLGAKNCSGAVRVLPVSSSISESAEEGRRVENGESSHPVQLAPVRRIRCRFGTFLIIARGARVRALSLSLCHSLNVTNSPEKDRYYSSNLIPSRRARLREKQLDISLIVGREFATRGKRLVCDEPARCRTSRTHFWATCRAAATAPCHRRARTEAA